MEESFVINQIIISCIVCCIIISVLFVALHYGKINLGTCRRQLSVCELRQSSTNPLR